MKRLIATFRNHPLLASAFTLALAATLFFSIRTVMSVVYWSDPVHRDQGLQGWMTPGYVSHSWELPRDLMPLAIGPIPKTRRPTLQAIADEQSIPLSDLINRIESAISIHRAAQ